MKPSEKLTRTRKEIFKYVTRVSEIETARESRAREKTVSDNTNIRKRIHQLIQIRCK